MQVSKESPMRRRRDAERYRRMVRTNEPIAAHIPAHRPEECRGAGDAGGSDESSEVALVYAQLLVDSLTQRGRGMEPFIRDRFAKVVNYN